MTPKQRAEKSAVAMWADDEASQWLGLVLDSVDAGCAVMSMQVQKHHTNGHEICHGGFLFTLADSAFAFACNSRNQRMVSQHNLITYVAPARIDDQLTARAVEVSMQGRNGIYDVRVTNQNNDLIAEFRGFCRSISGQHFDEETP